MEKGLIYLENESLKISISTRGGELQSVYNKKDGTEYLWQADPTYWGSKAPNLFPYIGRLTEGEYLYQGKRYPMEKHGFVRPRELTVEIHTDEMAVLSIGDTEELRQMYPFTFRYLLQYRLNGRMLQIITTVENRDTKTMYFAVGGHPGFNVPLDKDVPFEDYYLEFSEECDPKQVLFSTDCFVTGEEKDYPLEDRKKLYLRHDLFDPDALVLKDVAKSVTLKTAPGKHQITVQYPDMKYIGFWHKPNSDAPYLCIEPWSSLCSQQDVVTDLEKQPDLISLEAGKNYENRWSISFQ